MDCGTGSTSMALVYMVDCVPRRSIHRVKCGLSGHVRSLGTRLLGTIVATAWVPGYMSQVLWLATQTTLGLDVHTCHLRVYKLLRIHTTYVYICTLTLHALLLQLMCT